VGSSSPKALRNALKRLPTGSQAYDDAYQDIMGRINNQGSNQQTLAHQVLEWIVRAPRPLTITEIQHAIAVELDNPDARLDDENLSQEDCLVSVCAGLVTVDRETGVVRLVHYTAKEFFDRTQDLWFPRQQTDLTRVCLKYLSFEELTGSCGNDREYEERLGKHGFFRYAAENLGYHAQRSDMSTVDQSILGILGINGKLEALSQVLFSVAPGESRRTPYPGYSQLFPRRVGGIHLAAYFGLHSIVETILSKTATDHMDGSGMTALCWAAMGGHLEVVQLLLARGANAEIKDGSSMTPLLLATRNRHLAVVHRLLAGGAGIESRDSNGQTSLSWAVSLGCLDLAHLLLARGANVEATDDKDRTPLSHGARKGSVAIVKMLLDAGAKVDTVDYDNRTPLSFAVKHSAVVDLLVHAGADLNIKDRRNRTPLSFAAYGGHHLTVKLLLDHGSDINARDADGQTPLLLATMKGYQNIVSLLLSRESDTGTSGFDRQTLLSWAAQNGDAKIFSMLLGQGGDSVDIDRFGHLFWTIQNEHDDASVTPENTATTITSIEREEEDVSATAGQILLDQNAVDIRGSNGYVGQT